MLQGFPSRVADQSRAKLTSTPASSETSQLRSKNLDESWFGTVWFVYENVYEYAFIVCLEANRVMKSFHGSLGSCWTELLRLRAEN